MLIFTRIKWDVLNKNFWFSLGVFREFVWCGLRWLSKSLKHFCNCVQSNTLCKMEIQSLFPFEIFQPFNFFLKLNKSLRILKWPFKRRMLKGPMLNLSALPTPDFHRSQIVSRKICSRKGKNIFLTKMVENDLPIINE